ncbi:MAG TPA: hypothetical protein VLV78_22690 [Thermoanaerobaculia bacterium]|nr:hypothetical protein [Thermoanaerobaculia bacterium]
MNRRLSRAVIAVLFAVVLSLSTPSAFAAQRDGGWGPDFGSRIVRVLKNWMRHFGISSQDDINYPTPPKP